MSLRSCLVLVLGFAACGGDGKDADEPQTAREKMRREAKTDKKAKKDKQDKSDMPVDGTGKSWSKWRYSGDRAECYFRLGQKCFKTEATACAAARCKKPTKCHAEGAAPATISCEKPG